MIDSIRIENARCFYSSGYVSVQGKAGEINIHPNPTQNSLTISASYPITSAAITNFIGQTMYSRVFAGQSKNKVEIDVANLAPGIYLVRINDPDGYRVEVRKFVKE